jgi:Carboxypeptidase regulatory-like domain
MKRISAAFFIGLLSWTVTTGNAWAQATAQISGVVHDQSGAVLPGVELTATQTETGISRSTITNETGSYILSNLALGPYRLEATLPGFRTFVLTGITLQVNSNPAINPVLEVGQVTEQVEVQANVAQVETRSTAVGQVIENERILELPLNGRQVTDLITLSGAAVQTGTSNGPGSMPGGVQISIAGGLAFGVGYSLDGAMHSDPYSGSNHPMPFPDALQEFKVEAGGSAANTGMRSGGAVNAVTKSGTNEYHGDLFEFVRNYKFNARNFFALKRDSLKRNQYGGTLGGPILKNKLFFFGGYQGTKTRSDPGTTISFVPTAAMLAGDFTTFASPACNAGRQITLRAPFVNNQISPTLYSKVALNVAAKLPQAQDDCGRITYGIVNKLNEYQAVGKIDYQWNAKHSIFGRYLATAYSLTPPYSVSNGNVLTTTNPGFDDLAQAFALGHTYLVNPTTVNAFRMTVNRTAVMRLHAPYFSAPDMGVKSYSSLKDFMALSVTGGFTIGGSSASRATFRTTAYQLSDDINLVRGNHQTSLGVNIAHWRTNQYASARDPGIYSFNGNTTGLGMADFLLGNLSSLLHGSTTAFATRQDYVGAYVADTWKVTPRLTLNYGLRWEPFLPLSLTMGAFYVFDYGRFQQGIKSKVYPNAPAGMYFPGDPGFPENGSSMNDRWRIINPRIGLAWDPSGDGRTSIRASYGNATDFTISNQFGGSAISPPHGFIADVSNPGGGLEDPWRDYPGGSPVPYKPPQFTPFAAFSPVDRYDMQPPYVQSWTLSVQRQISSDWLASASYMGSTTIHLWATKANNNAVFFPGNPINGVCAVGGYVLRTTGTSCSTTTNTDQRRRLFLEKPQEGQYIGVLNPREDGGTGNYNGLLLSVQRRAARGINIGGNYTWSHCIGLPNLFSANESGAYLDPNNRDFERGNCLSDRRHSLNLTGVFSTPQFSNSKLRLMATGWRLSGIYRWSTGSYMTIVSGLDRALIGDTRGAGTQRSDQILANPYGNLSLTNYLNPNAFSQPILGTFGNMRPANIAGPGFWQFDMAMSRTFRLAERHNMEFRGEAFNLTNSLIKKNPATNLNSNTFGQINTSGDARIMQFVLKYIF